MQPLVHRIGGHGVAWVCLLAVLFAQTPSTRGAEPLEQFIAAMRKNDSAGMRKVVRLNDREMRVSCYSMLAEASRVLKQPVLSAQNTIYVSNLLTVSSRVARAFSEEFPSENRLYSPIKTSLPLLTAQVRLRVTSDLTLAIFLAASEDRTRRSKDRAAVRADLESIIRAVIETPDQRRLRLLEERLARYRKELAELDRKRRLARSRAEIEGLVVAKNIGALHVMLDVKSKETEERVMVIEALARIGRSESFDAVARHVDTRGLAKTAMAALVKIDSARAVGVLAGKLDDPSSAPVAAGLLGQVGGTPATKALTMRLARGGKLKAPLSSAIAGALSRILARFKQQVGAMQAKGDTLGLVALLKDDSGQAGRRKVVIEALGRVGGGPATSALVGLLADDSTWADAAEALSHAWAEARVAKFCGLISDRSLSAQQRRRAARIVGASKAPGAVPALIGHAGDAQVVEAVFAALGQVASPQAVTFLIERLADPSGRALAERALIQASTAAHGELSKALDEAGPSDRRARIVSILNAQEYQPQTSDERAVFMLAGGDATGVLLVGPGVLATVFDTTGDGDATMRWAAWRVLLLYLVAVLLLLAAAAAVCWRRWIWPSVKVAMPAGGYEQVRSVLRPLPEDKDAEGGRILRTTWACSLRGRRARIKVESFAREEDSSASGAKSRHDVLVSVGASVKPGKYLARGADGSVRIKVQRCESSGT